MEPYWTSWPGPLPDLPRPARRKNVFAGTGLHGVAGIVLLIAAQCFGQATGADSKAAEPAASTASRPPDQAPIPVQPPARPLHIVPFGPPTKAVRPRAAAGTEPVLPYWGGPVIANIHVVEVFWGSFVDAGSTNGLQQFFTDVTNSTYYDLLSEYSTVNRTGQGGAPGSSQLIGRGVFDGKYVITPSVCPGSTANPAPTCSLTDAQIQDELVTQLPNLPAPVTDTKGNFNTLYLIYFPPACTSRWLTRKAVWAAASALITQVW